MLRQIRLRDVSNLGSCRTRYERELVVLVSRLTHELRAPFDPFGDNVAAERIPRTTRRGLDYDEVEHPRKSIGHIVALSSSQNE